MDVKSLISNKIKDIVSQLYGLKDVEFIVEHPSIASFGDYASNVSMILFKTLGKSPYEVGLEIEKELNKDSLYLTIGEITYPIFDDIQVTKSGFINFTLSHKFLMEILNNIHKDKELYGSSSIGDNKKVIVEYSNINSNKPLHIGHARNNFIGSSLSNILSYVGFDVIKSNYVGDIGIHICKSMLMYQKYGLDKDPDKKSDHFVGDFYVLFEKEVEKDPTLLSQAQELLRRWESQDPEVISLWEKMNNWVYEGWEETYKDQGISFDIWEYESENVDVGKEITDIALEKGLAVRDESGAVIAELEKYGLPDKVLLRSDGTSLYSTKDLQLAKNSYEKYQFAKRLYVVDYRQSDYFKQIFKILELLGFDWYKNLYHIAYGMVSLPEGKLSSRTGVVANADDVYEELKESERREISKSTKMTENEDVINKVSMSALKYGMLKVDAKQNLLFSYDQVTKFEGNTGPYLLYTYARANSVLEKGGYSIDSFGFDLDTLNIYKMRDSEISLIKVLQRFPEEIINSANEFAPHIIAKYAFDLSSAFNSFYGDCKVLDAESVEAKSFRTALVGCTSIVLRNALNLLGIEVVNKM